MKVCASLDPQGGPRNEQLQQRSGRREGRTQHDRAHAPAQTAATGGASEHDNGIAMRCVRVSSPLPAALGEPTLAAMAEDTAAYTLKPGPKAELDGLRAAREESGPIAPRPGACPVRISPRVHPSLTCSPCDAPEMKVTREEMKAARLPLECAQLPLMRTTRAWPFNAPSRASALDAAHPPLHSGKGAGSLSP